MPLPRLNGSEDKGRKLPKIETNSMLPNLDLDEEDRGGFGTLLPNLEDEETITPVEPSEDIYFDDEEEPEEELPEAPSRKIPVPEETFEDSYEDSYEDSFGEPGFTSPFIDEKEPEEKEYIDRKKKRIIPFGGSRSKVTKKFGTKDYDKRVNRITIVKIIRIVVVLFMLGLFVLGLKNTFLPEQIYTPEEIEQIALLSVGNTGFPLERGSAFVEEFFTYYLQTNPDTTQAQSDSLSKFLKGNTGNKDGVVNTKPLKIKFLNKRETPQKIIAGPYVFQAVSSTENIGFYKVTALVSSNPTDPNESHWVSFSINLYYDTEKGVLSIADPPSIIPPYRHSFVSEYVPEENKRGNGTAYEGDMEMFNATIDGYIKAYANSSLTNNKDILQYVIPKPDSGLYSGFDGTVKLADGDNSISKTIWLTDNPNEYVADVKVDWVDVNSEDTISYRSRYTITLVKNDEGVLLVKNNIPYLYEELIED